jgi:CDP-diacylglycerol--inositol 3-phosphatidyltransferase
MSRLPVVLYVPNLLGYLRVVLACVGLAYATNPVTAVALWIVAALLDLVDGWAARLLNQTSRFGVVLDIVADNLLRTAVWMAAASADPRRYLLMATAVISLEWLTLAATQVHAASNGDHWKKARQRDPLFVQAYFRNNFRNPLGVLGVFGLFAAGLVCYGSVHPILYENVPLFKYGMTAALVGRGLSALVEVWLCGSFFSYILTQDRAEHEAADKTR